MAEAVQAASGAEPAGDSAQLKTGRAVLTTGGRLCRWRYVQDVCREEQLAAWGVEIHVGSFVVLCQWHRQGVGEYRLYLHVQAQMNSYRRLECFAGLGRDRGATWKKWSGIMLAGVMVVFGG
jgi:hypothetical protein